MLTGLFFGSFNPVHIGHLALANFFIAENYLNEVWFVVSPHNPLKEKSGLLDERHRFQLLKLAVGDYSKMKVSNIEFGLPQPSYTVNTLVRLSEKFPKREFALIMGADNLETFHKWKNYEEILKRYKLFIYPRPGYSGGKLVNHSAVKMTPAPIVEISSTQIRKWIKEKKDVRFYMQKDAWEYMSEMNFYKK